jgi:CheY-like chemotaxis protein
MEDDAMIGGLLAEVLAGLGHDVCAIASSEHDAVAAAARCRPDLMIVDVHLSVGDGVSAVARILRTGRIPHFFITGEAVQTVTLGAIVLQKPFREIDVVRAIERATA